MIRSWILGLVLVIAAGCSSVPSSPASTVQPSSAAITTPTASPSLTPAPTVSPTPTAAPTPTPAPTPDLDGTATRIVITSLKIDLPVVAPPKNAYPFCNVAMSLAAPFVLPGRPGATYIFAHPRAGMFLPILAASKVNNGKAMIGMTVDVYTSRNWRFTYAISAVHRHVIRDAHAADGPLAATSPELWLQTGEGPVGTRMALLVAAKLVSEIPASQAEAQPSAKPVTCG